MGLSALCPGQTMRKVLLLVAKAPRYLHCCCCCCCCCCSALMLLHEHFSACEHQYSSLSLYRLLWVPTNLSLQQILLTQRDHCSQSAVIGYQWLCPYIEVVLTSSVLTKTVYCISDAMFAICSLVCFHVTSG